MAVLKMIILVTMLNSIKKATLLLARLPFLVYSFEKAENLISVKKKFYEKTVSVKVLTSLKP